MKTTKTETFPCVCSGEGMGGFVFRFISVKYEVIQGFYIPCYARNIQFEIKIIVFLHQSLHFVLHTKYTILVR